MTAARREQLLSYVVLGVFAIVAIYPILSIVLLAFHKRSDLVTGFSIPDRLSFDTFKTGVGARAASTAACSTAFIVAATVADRHRGALDAGRLRVRGDALPRLRTRSSTCC